MTRACRAGLWLVSFLWISALAHAGVAGTIAKEAIEATLERAASKSSRQITGTAAKKAAAEEVARLSEKYGSGVLKVVEDSGLELLEAVPKYGDELVQLALKASPQARRALALNASELLPLARRAGVDAIELEAKVPGQAAHALQVFGDDAGKALARTVATEDLPRLIKYGEKADSGATRKVLLEAYQKEGSKLFERIPPKLVLASGLSASMIYGTHELTAPSRAMAEVLRENPDIVKDIMNRSTVIWAGVALLVILVLLWRFGLMPWHGRKTTQATGNESPRAGNDHRLPTSPSERPRR